jgi:hypothetical protein
MSRSPSRGGCFRPPAVRPAFPRRQGTPPQAPQISNREAFRLEIDATSRKQTTGPTSNRKNKASFSSHYRLARHPRPKNSNREAFRLETDATPRKQTAGPISNRENNGTFSSHDCPVLRSHLKISNREPLRLEMDVTSTKQMTASTSNRENTAVFLSGKRPRRLLSDSHHGHSHQPALDRILIERLTIRIRRNSNKTKNRRALLIEHY